MNIHQPTRAPSIGGATPSRRFIWALAATLLLVSACSREPGAWQEAQQHDTTAEYERYLASYPEGEHVTAARQRLEELAWQAAKSADTAKSLQAYLASYPAGPHKADADDRIAFLKEAVWWEKLGTPEFVMAHIGDIAAEGLQVGTSIQGLIQLDNNMRIASISPSTKLHVSLVEMSKSGRSTHEDYVFVAQFGTVGLFRSEKRGALVLISQQILVPVPTPDEIAAYQPTDTPEATESAAVASLLESAAGNGGDVFSIWKRRVLSGLKTEIEQTDFATVRREIAILALLPLPGVEKWLTDERFKSLPDAAKIVENRKKLLEAVHAAGSIRVATR